MSNFPWRNFPINENDFIGKKILITGAANGIGRALTLELSRLGVTVLMLDKKSRHLEILNDEIIDRGWQQPIILPIDLDDITPDTATHLAQSIYDDLGVIDGLLHNAAELGVSSPLDQYELKYWNTVFQVNLHATYFLSRALLPLLRQDHQTNLIFTTASVARNPEAYWGAYAIAYAGVEAQMKIWAEELENTSNIKVNSIDPGEVRTSLRRRSHPGESQEQLVPPKEIVNAYLYLLGSSHDLHGEQLIVQ